MPDRLLFHNASIRRVAKNIVNCIKMSQKAQETGKEDYSPYDWMKMHPKELPVDDVKRFLRLVKFQEPILREASLHSNFSMNRSIKDVDNPIMYLLPEINSRLARDQNQRILQARDIFKIGRKYYLVLNF